MKRKSNAVTVACRAFRWLLPLAIIVSASAVALAQAPRATPDPGLPKLNRQDDSDPMTSIEEEMRAKRAIKFAEKEYQENIERAHELADLGSKLGESFKKNERFDREDLKRLDRLEKLTKAIRSAAGGSENEKDVDRYSVSFTVNVNKLLDVVDSLAKRVEKTPRHVISAAVIDEANVLLELIRRVREFSPKA